MHETRSPESEKSTARAKEESRGDGARAGHLQKKGQEQSHVVKVKCRCRCKRKGMILQERAKVGCQRARVFALSSNKHPITPERA